MLRESQDLIRRVRRRELYKCVGKSTYTRESHLYRKSEKEISSELLELVSDSNMLSNNHHNNNGNMFNEQIASSDNQTDGDNTTCDNINDDMEVIGEHPIQTADNVHLENLISSPKDSMLSQLSQASPLPYSTLHPGTTIKQIGSNIPLILTEDDLIVISVEG